MSEDERPNPAHEDEHASNPDTGVARCEPPRKPAIKIGSQRDAARAEEVTDEGEQPAVAEAAQSAELSAAPAPVEASEFAEPVANSPVADLPAAAASPIEMAFPAPRIQRISADLQAEIDEALGDVSIEALLAAEAKPAPKMAPAIELDQRCLARVIKCDREFVFLSLVEGPEQGVAPRRLFAELPAPGTQIEVIPVRYGVDDNLYEVIVPGASVEVQDWSDLSEGVVVEARITGHNKGGLECEVNQIRGFIPAGQVSLYRVEDLESYVGQSLRCVVTEANPQRRNLVLSHRAVLEREKQEARERLLQELQVGQEREGIVRRLQDFGAFVDLGGIDGLIHVSQLSWDRIAHPRDVLEEGQKVRVRISKIDPATGRIGLSYRDLLEDPWQEAANRFAVGSVLEGTVAKIMEFGAFVKLAPGVEGLVHISEIAHQRVHKVAAFLKEGQVVQVKVLSIDPENQRLSLSIKAAQAAPPQPEEAEQEGEAESEPAPGAVPGRTGPLQGGLSRKTGGEKFGLNW